ncbi:MAG TPA: DUF4383 domain-containing protein [Candidatus Microbacterium pullistercoris]|nr:DUF4383 domain-containing protein [Candidatus Microbacterium pullistercoris]
MEEEIVMKSANRLVGVIFGAVYLVVGVLGFFVTMGVGFLATEGSLLLGVFEVNPLHNIVHLAVGAALLVGGLAGVAAARAAGVRSAQRAGRERRDRGRSDPAAVRGEDRSGALPRAARVAWRCGDHRRRRPATACS